ncbi:hypothetical protein P4O66_012454, partial [Electrophorus voltai]
MLLTDDSTVIFRVRGMLDFSCQLDISNEKQGQSAITRCFEGLRSKISSESLVFLVCNSPVLLWPNKGLQSTVEHLTEETPCRDIHQYITVEDGGSKKASKKKERKDASVVNLKLLMEVTEAGDGSAPSLCVLTRRQHCARMPVSVDCVLSANGFDPLQTVCRGLVGALRRQLLDMEDAVLRHRKGSSLLAPQAFHFPLPTPGNLITVVYPAGVAESQLLSLSVCSLQLWCSSEFSVFFTQVLHRKYGLPSDRPYFRRANAFHFPDEPYRDGYLRNPHAHLTPPSMEDSKVGTWDS